MSNFKVGDVCIIQNACNPSHNGMECTIVIPFDFYLSEFGHWDGALYCCGVETPDGEEFSCTPDQLRKKQPPKEPATWETVQSMTNWNPAGVPANV